MKLRRMLLALLALLAAITIQAAQQSSAARVMFEAARKKEVIDGDLKGAIQQYKEVVSRFKNDRAVVADALIRMAESYQKLGDAEAVKVYEQLVQEFADQKDAAATAKQRLTMLRPTVAAASLPAARQIWSSSTNGPPSGDGRFVTRTLDTGDLAVSDLTTGTTRNLTNTGGWAVSGDYVDYAAISPDGKQVAYTWFLAKERRNELRVLQLAGGDSPRPKTLSTGYMKPFGWSPDGKQIFVVHWVSGANTIGTVSMDGTFRNLKSLDWRQPSHLSVSSDGRYIAYDLPAGDNTSPRDIFVLATDGSREVTAVGGAANDFSPVWSPDNSRLVFISDRSGSNSIWTVPIANGRQGTPEPVNGSFSPSSLLGMTRAGALYYGISSSERRNIYVAELDENMRATTPAVPATERFVNGNAGPSWSRDGAYLAYYSFRNPPVLVVRSAKTGEEKTVPLPAGVMSAQGVRPKWFPDNSSLLVVAQNAQGQGYGLFRLVLATGKTDLLRRFEGFPNSYDVSPDGKTIYFLDRSGAGRLIRFDLDSGREVELKKDEYFTGLALSPDGTELAYLKSLRTDAERNAGESPSVVEVMPTAGGQARQVYRAAIWLSGSRFGTLTWTPDGRSLIFGLDDGEFWKVPASGGKPERMGIALNDAWDFKSPTIHPDGRRMVFAAVAGSGSEVWALERFLPAGNTIYVKQ